MSQMHTVKRGETLSSIASKYGLSRWEEIYHHPANADFRQKRRNPNLLFPGDVVFVPDSSPLSQVPTAETLTPGETLQRARGTLELASRSLEGGRGEQAANILEVGARELELVVVRARPHERPVLDALVSMMRARAASYRQTAPRLLQEKTTELIAVSRKALTLSRGLGLSKPRLAKMLEDAAIESLVQAELLLHAAENTAVLIGKGVSQTYRALINASFDKAIVDSGGLNNLLTGKRDLLEADKRKMNEVFDYLDKRMEREGLSFDHVWSVMFDDNRIASKKDIPSFPTAHEAAVFPRDHEVTRGLLIPISALSRALTAGDMRGVDTALAELIQALRKHGQWEIARSVLDALSKNARTDEGVDLARKLNDNERREWWSQRAESFVQKDLPVLLLSCLVSGGIGAGARALAALAGWGTRVVRGAQVAAEILSFVPTERVLNDVINNRRADWSAGGLARDYALAAASYGLFYTLGVCWRAWRAPADVTADAAKTAATPPGNPTKFPSNEARENIKAYIRENESAVTLRRSNYPLEQNPKIPGGNVPGVKKPDYRIGSELFDNYAPTTRSERNVWTNVQGKVQSEQARRIVLNLDDSAVNLDKLRKQFAEWPVEGLEQVLVVKNGQVFSLRLAKPPPGPTPMGYPDRRE
jgi:hypothetical protein